MKLYHWQSRCTLLGEKSHEEVSILTHWDQKQNLHRHYPLLPRTDQQVAKFLWWE